MDKGRLPFQIPHEPMRRDVIGGIRISVWYGRKLCGWNLTPTFVPPH